MSTGGHNVIHMLFRPKTYQTRLVWGHCLDCYLTQSSAPWDSIMPTQVAMGVTRKAGKHEPVRGSQQAVLCFRLLPQPLSMTDESVTWNEQFPPQVAFAQSILSQRRDESRTLGKTKSYLNYFNRANRKNGRAPSRQGGNKPTSFSFLHLSLDILNFLK